MKKHFKLYVSLVLILMILFFNFSVVNASIDTDAYKGITQGNKSDYDTMYDIAGKVLGVIQVIGVATATIMIVFVSIKYFTTSVAEKASIKESIMGFVIGAIILFGVSGFLSLVRTMVAGFDSASGSGGSNSGPSSSYDSGGESGGSHGSGGSFR